MARAALVTRFFEDHAAALEHFEAQGWTDGLPIVPPTPRAVTETLAAAGLDGSELMGELPQRQRELTAWQAATFAVMAGCSPAYFPVVVATWRAVFDPRLNLHAALTSTGGAALAAIVSGPYAAEIQMNASANVFGPGNRANATIGRAIRLGAIVALAAVPGDTDASSFGHQGKFTFHFAESDPPSPWLPIREQLGFPQSATTVTVLPSEAPRQVKQALNPEPQGLLRTVAACIKNPSYNGAGKGAYCIVVLGPEHSWMLVQAGWDQARVREFLGTATRVTVGELAAAGVLLETAGMNDMTPAPDGTLPTTDAGDILLATAGGPGAGFSAVIPSWTGKVSTHPVTRPVILPGTPTPVSSGPLDGLHYL